MSHHPLVALSACLLFSFPLHAAQDVIAVSTNTAPVVDGQAGDTAWANAPEVITKDSVAGIDIRLRAVYTTDQVFFLVRFPDDSPNREHKNLIWDDKDKRYRTGTRREDSFVFKWNMEPFPIDLALAAGNLHKADIWYWKSVRTDHAGRADDKHHIYSEQPIPKANAIVTTSGRTMYLRRKGDSGKAAYRVEFPSRNLGREISSIIRQQPEGSRADVQAKGHWADGEWTVEFSRRLDTGHNDDLAFDTAQAYDFGVSRYEIAGRPVDADIEEPYFGSGDVGESLTLRFRR